MRISLILFSTRERSQNGNDGNDDDEFLCSSVD